MLTLYDPDRSQTVTYLGQTRTWDEALAAIRDGHARNSASNAAPGCGC